MIIQPCPADSPLQSFPHLTDAEFSEACSTLLNKFELHGHRQVEWTAVEAISQSETTYLSITKPLAMDSQSPDTGDDDDETEITEQDDEIAETPIFPRVVVRYDVVLSPSYRVPVLYFAISDPLHRYPPTIETLYSVVIPPAFTAQIKQVGVIGGITTIDHPATGKPVFFIHPCRTVEVMEASSGGQDIPAYDYLLLWIGALGKCVGLNVPLPLVDAVQEDG